MRLASAPHTLHGNERGKSAARDEATNLMDPRQRKLPVGGTAHGGAAVVDAPYGERRGHHGDADPFVSRDLNDPIPVLMHAEAFAERDGNEEIAGCEQRGGLHQSAGIGDAGAAEEIVGDGLRGVVEARRKDAAPRGGFGDEAAADDREPGGRLADGAHLALDFAGEPLIVVIEEGDPVAAGHPDTGVAGCGASTGGGQQHGAQTGIRQSRQTGFGFGIGPVDDHDDFEGVPGLTERAADGRENQVGTAAGGDDRRHQRMVPQFLHVGHGCVSGLFSSIGRAGSRDQMPEERFGNVGNGRSGGRVSDGTVGGKAARDEAILWTAVRWGKARRHK